MTQVVDCRGDDEVIKVWEAVQQMGKYNLIMTATPLNDQHLDSLYWSFSRKGWAYANPVILIQSKSITLYEIF